MQQYVVLMKQAFSMLEYQTNAQISMLECQNKLLVANNLISNSVFTSLPFLTLVV